MTKRGVFSMMLAMLLILAALYAYHWVHSQRSEESVPEPEADVQKAEEQLYAIRDNGRYGYIDEAGFVVIKPQYEDAYHFSEGLGRAGIHHKYGFVDKTGRFVIEPIYDDAADFTEGMARVGTNNRYGFVNIRGETTIPLDYELVSFFSEGLAAFYADGKWGYMNNRGDVLIQPRFDSAGPFVKGLAAASEGGRYGYINNEGEYVIKPQYDFAYDFSEGLAKIALNQQYGFIDTKGNIVIQPRFEGAQDFSEGRAAVLLEGKWGFIDNKGRFVVQPIFHAADSFSDGRAAVSEGKLWGYIDPDGNMAISPQYSYADRFFKGLATVRIDDVLSIVDRDGKLVWHETEKVDIQGRDGVLGKLVKMKVTSKQYDLMIKYPDVLDMKDQMLQRKLNAILMKQSGTGYKGQPNETYRQDYDVMLNKNGIMSIVNNSYMYMAGAAHGMSMRSTINMDMTTGHLYRLEELFKPGVDYKARLNDIIRNQIAEGNIPLLREFKGINDNQEFYLTDKELVIYYQLYDYTPYAYGFLEFYIPYEKIGNILDKEGPIPFMME